MAKIALFKKNLLASAKIAEVNKELCVHHLYLLGYICGKFL